MFIKVHKIKTASCHHLAALSHTDAALHIHMAQKTDLQKKKKEAKRAHAHMLTDLWWFVYFVNYGAWWAAEFNFSVEEAKFNYRAEFNGSIYIHR